MNLKALANLFRKPPTAVEELQAALNRLDVGEAEKEVDALEARRRELLLTADDNAIAVIDEKIRLANTHVERVALGRQELQRRIVEARAAEGEAEKAARYEQAIKVSDDAVALLRTYPDVVKPLLQLLATVAHAETLVEAANAALPLGASMIASVEQRVRGLPGVPAEIGAETRQSVWYYVGDFSSPVGADLVSSIDTSVPRPFVTRIIGGRPERHPVERRTVVRRQVRDAVPAFVPTPLAAAVSLPGLLPGQPDLWTPSGPSGYGGSPIGIGCHEVVDQAAQALSNLNAPSSDPRSAPQTRIETRVEPAKPASEAA